jgi:uncharacterized phiE125 gp8 family phage protein
MTSYLLSGPAAEPVSLAEAHVALRLDDNTQDGLVATLITAARMHVEAVTGRALISQSWRVVLDCLPLGGFIALPVGPVLSVTAITALDSAGAPHALPLDGVSPGLGEPPRLFLPPGLSLATMLRPAQGIEIDYVAGFGSNATDVPAPLRQAMLLLVAYWFENRESLSGTSPGVPAGLDLLIAPYRMVRL